MKEEILLEIKKGLNSGLSHQVVFDELKDKYYKQGKLLTDLLCKTPIPTQKEKFKGVWVTLLVVLGILAALRGISILVAQSGFEQFINGFFFLILVYVIYSVYKYEKYTFQFLGVLGIVNALWIWRTYVPQQGPSNFNTFISLVLVATMSVCSYIIYYKLFVKHRIEKVPVKYMDGRQGFEIQARFVER